MFLPANGCLAGCDFAAFHTLSVLHLAPLNISEAPRLRVDDLGYRSLIFKEPVSRSRRRNPPSCIRISDFRGKTLAVLSTVVSFVGRKVTLLDFIETRNQERELAMDAGPQWSPLASNRNLTPIIAAGSAVPSRLEVTEAVFSFH